MFVLSMDIQCVILSVCYFGLGMSFHSYGKRSFFTFILYLHITFFFFFFVYYNQFVLLSLTDFVYIFSLKFHEIPICKY